MIGPHPPVHPGEILREEFLKPLEMSAYGLSKCLRVPRTRIEGLVREETPVTADTALRLGRYFANLQSNHDLALAAEDNPDIGDITPRAA